MANFRLPTATRNAIADAFTTLIDAGASAGVIKIYDGTQPASANDAVSTQTLLAELTFTDPSAGSAASGILTFSAITSDSSANATGTATWARIVDSNGTTIFDCDVNTTGATINLSSVSIVAGAPVAITSFTITVPSGE